jgi:type VI secretion system protein ImpM
MEGTPGWYGKLPSTGDFASRRLPHEIIEPWDTWLAEELAGLKAQSDDWLNAYLDSPTWRFVVPARWVHAGQAGLLAGVLMPSVDSVGRYFPLSIMAALPDMPSHAGALAPVLNWLHALDDLAADALQEDWPIDTLEGALSRLPVPRPDPLAVSGMSPLLAGDRRMVSIAVPETRQDLMGGIGQALLQWVLASSGGQAPNLGWWWCEPHAMVQQRQLLVSAGLPCGMDFATLLGSNHDRHAVAAVAPAASFTPPATPAPHAGQPDAMAVSGVAFMAVAQRLEASDETMPPISAAQLPAAMAAPASQDDGDATLPPVPRGHAMGTDTARPEDVPAPAQDALAEADTEGAQTALATEAETAVESDDASPEVTADSTDEVTAVESADTPSAAHEEAPVDTADIADIADAADEATIPAISTLLADADTPSENTPDPDQTLPHTDGVA